jgi:hypothetical protein
LAFSDDEQILLTGGPDSMPRFWRVPQAGFAADRSPQSSAHRVWNPAADRGLAAAPDGTFVAIGDPSGHVHIIPSDATLSEVAEISEDVSFVGHNSHVRLLGVASSGSFVASVAADNTLRVWRASNGEPLPYVVDIPGPAVSDIVFSPDANYIGLLSGSRAILVDASDGSVVAEFVSASTYSGMTFAANKQLYLGGQDGTLQLVSLGADNNWSMRQVWQGREGIKRLRASPRGDFLILVDQMNRASQFLLADGIMGEGTLQLPSNVQEIAFDSNGTRAYFRTSRWVHRASSSISGLIWMDALFVPRIMQGARIVHGNGTTESDGGYQMYLPVARNAYVDLVELGYGATTSTGLFGNKDDLLQEWRDRINANFHEVF